jgi:aspartyl-tRNA(Asn)/glutamyl-tRNA(Gln) amidotransferase subunit B
MHDQDPADSLIDLNRAGVPLLEIVSEPDLHSADEVVAYMEALRRLVRWIDVSDGNMEEGSLRCDVNISVRPAGSTQLGKRCEVKNINSMRFARKAIEFEAKRQIDLLEKGQAVRQETRGFDPATGTTYSLREKEDALDYRYFPEPDLPPVVLTEGWIQQVQKGLPVLPHALATHFQQHYGLPAYDADLLTQERETAFYFDELAALAPPLAKSAANLVINKLLPWSAEKNRPLRENPVALSGWVAYLQLIEAGKVSASTAAQKLFPALLESPDTSPLVLAESLGLIQNADSDFLSGLATEVLERFPDKVKEYKNGKKGLIGFFMGELMKAAKGAADPQAATKILQEKLR